MQKNNGLKILFVSAEVSPYAKTGGLADVAGSLPQQLKAMGNDIRIVMPGYKEVKENKKYIADFPVQMGPRKETCIVRSDFMNFNTDGKDYELPIYFIDNYHYFDRNGIYGHFDDGERFAFFCNAVVSMLPAIGFMPDIIHLNDWHTGPVGMLLKENDEYGRIYEKTGTVFTIHNLEYQGCFPREILNFFDVPENVFTPEKVEYYGSFNFAKAGIVYCDVINTVSEHYAGEIKTPEFGAGLDGLLRKRSSDLFGIVNGISYARFNPARDSAIEVNYSEENYLQKYGNKSVLQREMGLPEIDVPLLGLVSRLTGQKGLELIFDTIDDILKLDVQFVLLGIGDPYYENAFEDIKKRYPDQVGVYIGFNEKLAQRIYAGSDIFLMPSRFEPCGLSQIISLRYGTIPVVRNTGGLAETIIDFNKDPENGNGFVFDDFDPQEMLNAVNRAIKLCKEQNDVWRNLVKRAMGQDFSWKNPALKYLKLYNKAINNGGGK